MIKDKTIKSKSSNIVFLIVFGIIICLFSIIIACFFGAADIGFKETCEVFAYKLGIKDNISQDYLLTIIWKLRMPRILLALAIGVTLSGSGVVMQAATTNVMAEPYTLGVASGAAAAATMYIAFFENKLGQIGITAFAFLGAVLVFFLVYRIASIGNSKSSVRLILTGVVVSMIAGAIVQLIISLSPPGKIASIVFWSMGSTGRASWSNLGIPLAAALFSSIALLFYSEKINLLSLGNETATVLGLNVGRVRREIITIISIATGSIVAYSGMIGFVGLIVPHIVRKIVGADHRKLLPVSMIYGGIFMIWADSVARTIISPEELPIGVLTALIGGPLFLVLLRKKGDKIA